MPQSAIEELNRAPNKLMVGGTPDDRNRKFLGGMVDNEGRQHGGNKDGRTLSPDSLTQNRCNSRAWRSIENTAWKFIFEFNILPFSIFKSLKHLRRNHKSGSSYPMVLETLGYISFPIHHQYPRSYKLYSTPKILATILIDANQQ